MVKDKVKRPLAVNLIIAWLILLPIMNIAVLTYSISQPIIKETQTLSPNYYFYVGMDVTSASTNSVELSSDNYVNLYLMDKTELDKALGGEEWEYYSEGSRFNTSYSDFQVDLPIGEWYFFVENPHESESVKVNLEVNYIESVESYGVGYTSSPSYTPPIGVIGLILLFYAIRSLWRMEKSWLWYVYFILGLGVIINILSFFWWGISLLYWIDWVIIGQIAISSYAIYWLYKNRTRFAEPKKEKSNLGSKGEWLRMGLIILGLIGIPIFTFLINSDYILWSILVVPLWGIFVWFILPKRFKWLK